MASVLALVSFRIFPARMGGQKGVAMFYSHLQRHHQILLAVSTDNEPAVKNAIRILYRNRLIILNIFRLKTLVRLMRSQKAEVIIAEHSYTGWIAWLLHRSTGIPFIIHSHNIESRRFREMKYPWWFLYARYEKWIHSRAHHNFFISEEDLSFALSQWNLNRSACTVITYGVEPRERNLISRDEARKSLGLGEDENILFFNGTLDYRPNREAVEHLLKAMPLLERYLPDFRVIITGNRAPGELVKKMAKCGRVDYFGFVDQIDPVYRAASLFINPVMNDTGIKTKLVEAIANDCTAVSMASGASGINREACGRKLVIVADGDWPRFAEAIVRNLGSPQEATPQQFFDHYSWENIAARAGERINQTA